MNIKLLAIGAAIISLCTGPLFAQNELPALLFPYQESQIQQLDRLTSDFSMSKDQLEKWDRIASNAVEEQRLSYFDSVRVFTYLYIAQAQAAAISQKLKGNFMGSLDPISYGVLCLFFPRQYFPTGYETDRYSEMLASIIYQQIKARVMEEDALPFHERVPERLKGTYTVGLQVAKWMPWLAKPSMEYWPEDPPAMSDPSWQKQTEMIKQTQKKMTAKNQDSVYYWAGLTGPESGNWRAIMNQYLFSHHIPLGKMLQVREVVMIGLYDSIIVYVGAKYRYLVDRPKVYDESVQYLIEVPAHPSYPSGHSTESFTVASILAHYFPENTKFWYDTAEKACLSRIYGGIHYPTDDQHGRESGKKVAEKILQSIQQQQSEENTHFDAAGY